MYLWKEGEGMCNYGRGTCVFMEEVHVYLWKVCKGCVEGCVPMEGRDVHVPMEGRDDVYLYCIGTLPFLS